MRSSSGRGYLLSGEKSTFQRSNSNSSSLLSRFTTTLTGTPSSSINSASAIFFPKRRSRLLVSLNRKLPIPPSFISFTRRSGSERKIAFASGLFRTIAAMRSASSFRSFLQSLISGSRDSTDIDSSISGTKRSVFERNSTDADISSDVCPRQYRASSPQVSLDRGRDRNSVKAQLFRMTEGVMHLVFVRTKSGVWLLRDIAVSRRHGWLRRPLRRRPS